MYSDSKIQTFEYAIYKMIEWFKQVVSPKEEDWKYHFSRLASLKLLFFISALKTDADPNSDMLDIFDNFCAMQYGPVEVDIYSAIVAQKTKFYSFGNRELTIKAETVFGTMDRENKTRVDRAISKLREINPKLISCQSSQLVNITHKWDAWQIAMATAQLYGKGSEPMSKESIRLSTPFYE